MRELAIRPSTFWRNLLILAAVLFLGINVATRYGGAMRPEAGRKIVTSRALDGKRQHLLNNGLHWSAPAAEFVLFKPATASLAISPEICAVTRFYRENSLHNRPPPSCLEH